MNAGKTTRLPERKLPGILAVLVLLGTTACMTVGPDYAPPTQIPPAAWHAQLPAGITASPSDSETLAQWWMAFNDPMLSQLIDRAIRNNLDLRSALSRVRQARSQRAIAQSALWPTLSFSGSAQDSRTRTRDKQLGTINTDNHLYNTGFDASWEMDVFGGVQRSIEASDYDLKSTQAALYDALVSLTAETALNYVDVRSYQTRIDLAENNLKLQQETLDLAEARFQVELIDELAVQQARYGYQSTAAQIPTLRAGLDAAMNQLAVLLGETPGTLHEMLTKTEPIPAIPASIAIGVPGETLRRRPDIRQAEDDLAAQTARIGVAVADLYPKFTLGASLNRQGTGTLGFRRYPTDSLSIGPRVSWNLFEGGALRANVNVKTELQKQALLTWQSAVLRALQDAEDKIYALGQEQQRNVSLVAAADAAKMALDLARDKFQVGQIDFTDVLNAEQSLVSFQDQMAQSQGQITSDAISLYKALGGGWSASLPIGGEDHEQATERNP